MFLCDFPHVILQAWKAPHTAIHKTTHYSPFNLLKLPIGSTNQLANMQDLTLPWAPVMHTHIHSFFLRTPFFFFFWCYLGQLTYWLLFVHHIALSGPVVLQLYKYIPPSYPFPFVHLIGLDDRENWNKFYLCICDSLKWVVHKNGTFCINTYISKSIVRAAELVWASGIDITSCLLKKSAISLWEWICIEIWVKKRIDPTGFINVISSFCYWHKFVLRVIESE